MSVLTIQPAFNDQMAEVNHYPVMHRQILESLDLQNRKVVVDCTVGAGALAQKVLSQMSPEALFVGMDKDEDTFELVRKRLGKAEERIQLFKADFTDLDKVLEDLDIKEVDTFIFDLGISTPQLSNPERGFSFLKDGPLDMRMDKNAFVSAYDLVNNLSERELANIFRKFGEERHYRKVANFLVRARKNKPIATTAELTNIITDAIGTRYRDLKIHPATRVFQSLRIAVNRELTALEEGLKKAIPFLSAGARIAVISFHSLEDRIVKHTFRDYAQEDILKIITKKPLLPDDEEIRENPASRSAKLRIAEKI